MANTLLPHSSFCAIQTDGALDSTFNAGVFTNGQIKSSLLQADGKLVIGGYFTKVHGVARPGLARLMTDGTLDMDFAPSGSMVNAESMVLQDDGRIITCSSSSYTNVTRFNSDGSVDSSFNLNHAIAYYPGDDGAGNATSPGRVSEVLLQPGGKIVVVGQFFYIITGPGTWVARSCIARFNNDGTFDPSFDPGLGADNFYSSTAIQHIRAQKVGANNGKLIVAGQFNTFNGHGAASIARLDADGSFDNSFSVGSGDFNALFTGTAGIFLQSNDQILIWGNFGSFNGVSIHGFVRLSSSGSVDTTFATEEFNPYPGGSPIFCLAQQSDGRLLIGGTFHLLGNSTANNIVRLETNGSRDPNFNSDVAAGPSAQNITTILARSDGMIFVGGDFSAYDNIPRGNLAWITPSGSLDSSFDGLPGATDSFPVIYTIATQSDGKILVGGLFSTFNGSPHNNIVRLKQDATIDSAFDGTLGTSGWVRAILVQPDGKIVIGGNFQSVNGVPRSRIARLNSDGILDTTFNPDRFLDGPVYALTQDSFGSIYVAGNFDDPVHNRSLDIEKLTPSGAVDPSFDPTRGGYYSGFYGGVYSLVLDGAGGIIVGGSFTSYNGSFTPRGLARLDATTAWIDSSFNRNNSGFNGTARSILRTPDGKYYVGGSITVRVNSDGSRDNSFKLSSSPYAYAMALQNGKLFVAGYDPNNSPICFVRYDSSGNLDPTLVTGTNFAISPGGFATFSPAFLEALTIQADGRLLVGGQFNQYNGALRVCLARLTDSRLVSLKITSVNRSDPNDILIKGVGAPNSTYVVEASLDLNPNNFAPIGNTTCDAGGSWQFTDAYPQNPTKSFYRLTLPATKSASFPPSGFRSQ
ncbi:MAG: delta-60 repeat domain-containing protein [Chthoniobacterales bacterium]